MQRQLSKKPGVTRGKVRGKVAKPPSPTPIGKILTTTDFSDDSLAGVHYATALARRFKATLTLVHVIEPPSRLAGMEAVAFAREDSEVTKWASAQLRKLAGLKMSSFVRTGRPFDEITTAARERAVDLIVMATHGYTGAKHALLGSTTERVVRHATCSVLTVPARTKPKPKATPQAFKLKTILVPIDFSDVSKKALAMATALAGQTDAQIILIHVVEKFPIDYLLGRELMNETIASLKKQATADLKQMVETLRKSTKVGISAVVGNGKPFVEICEAANEVGADLIALTTHGYTGVKRAWFGSTAERVVRHAECPVLVVRDLKRRLETRFS